MQDFHSINPLPYPEYLNTFMMQTIVSRNLSGSVLSELNELLINLKRGRQKSTLLYMPLLKYTLNVLAL